MGEQALFECGPGPVQSNTGIVYCQIQCARRLFQRGAFDIDHFEYGSVALAQFASLAQAARAMFGHIRVIDQHIGSEGILAPIFAGLLALQISYDIAVNLIEPGQDFGRVLQAVGPLDGAQRRTLQHIIDICIIIRMGRARRNEAP